MSKLYRLIRYDWPLHLVLMLTNILPDNVAIMKMRGFLISPFFKQCGKGLTVGRNNVFYRSYNMVIGDNVYIAYGNWFNAADLIRIEDEVLFGPKSIIVCSNHTRKEGSFKRGKPQIAPIRIGFGSWIGGNCALLAGCSIGKGSVIAANTVVRGEVPDDSLFAGNPGEVKKRITDA